MPNVLSEENLQELLRQAQQNNGFVSPRPFGAIGGPQAGEETDDETSIGQSPLEMPSNAPANKPLPRPPPHVQQELERLRQGADSPTLSSRLSGWWNRSKTTFHERPSSMYEMRPKDARRLYEQLEKAQAYHHRKNSLVDELGNQSRVFFDDEDFDKDQSEGSEVGQEGKEESDSDGEVPSEVGTYLEDEEPVTDGDEGLRIRRTGSKREESPSVVG
jgi:hypothetical protein